MRQPNSRSAIQSNFWTQSYKLLQKYFKFSSTPSTLICSEQILHNDLYSIITTKRNLTYVMSSLNHHVAFGVPSLEKHVNFETFIAQYHTARELERIRKEIVPILLAMRGGDHITQIIEFATPRGLIKYDVAMMSIRGSCIAVTFTEHKPKSSVLSLTTSSAAFSSFSFLDSSAISALIRLAF